LFFILFKKKFYLYHVSDQILKIRVATCPPQGGMASDNDDDRVGSYDLFNFMRTAYQDVKRKGEIELELRVASLRGQNETLQDRYDTLVMESTANYAAKDKAFSEERQLSNELHGAEVLQHQQCLNEILRVELEGAKSKMEAKDLELVEESQLVGELEVTLEEVRQSKVNDTFAVLWVVFNAV
jgi:hypothetical protein